LNLFCQDFCGRRLRPRGFRPRMCINSQFLVSRSHWRGFKNMNEAAMLRSTQKSEAAFAAASLSF
jgi:hypothetical protein